MTEFGSYFRLGMEHISDLSAYDHIVFLMALVAVYSLQNWKHVVILVTAFTLGHSVTLALAALGYIPVRVELIEFLIPVTIFFTALYNLWSDKDGRHFKWKYLIAFVFGLVHGVGFSNFFRTLLGSQADIVSPLLAFNLGVELGQLVIVMVALAASYFVVDRWRLLNRRDWTVLLSGAAIGIALILMQETAFW